MRAPRLALRLLLCSALVGTLVALPQGTAQAQPGVTQSAPIGRLSSATGPVSLRAPDRPAWGNAAPGRMLQAGQTLRTGPRSQAELELGANRAGLDPDTVLRFDATVPGGFVATLEQGRVMLLLRSLQPGQAATLVTPRGTITFGQPGLYVVDAGGPGDGSRPATVGVTRGLAQIYGAGVSVMVRAGQTAVLSGGVPAQLRAGVAEGFLADDPSAPPPNVFMPSAPLAYAPPPFVPPAVTQLPGGDVLLRDGSWEQSPEYGAVWYPPVPPGWAPYADGYGTYADRTPWGYAPYRYGNWARVGPRWGWLPPRGYDRPHERPYERHYERPYDRPYEGYYERPYGRSYERPYERGGPPVGGGGYRQPGGNPLPPVLAPPSRGFDGPPPVQPRPGPLPSVLAPPVMAPRPSPPPMMAAPPPRPAAPPSRTCGVLSMPC